MTTASVARLGWRGAAALALTFCAPLSPAFADGTPAGTEIVNVARLTWIDGSETRSLESNSVALRVDERIDVAVAWLDGGSLPVNSGEQGRALSFRVVNAGNAPEAFRLAAIGSISGDQFDPAISGLALDSNGNGMFDPGVDQLYRSGIDDPLLAADASVTVFVIGTMPGGLADAALGLAALQATAVTGSGTPGTTFAGKGERGTDAVVGATTASAQSTGSYIASLVVPKLTKSQQVVDPNGGGSALPGAIITYTLSATYSGSVPTSAGLVEDPIPAGTSYVPGSLKLNGIGLSDLPDGDQGQAGSAGVRVAIGSLSNGGKAVITFQVRVNN